MKSILLTLLLLPVTLLAQRNTESFGKFTAADGTITKGSVTAKGYERQIEVTNLVAKNINNNTVIKFSMPISSANGIFRNALNSKQKLRSGEITVTTLTEAKRVVNYKINMEDIKIEECTDVNDQTLLQLKATRIGWTYYAPDRLGGSTIVNKSGWDASNQKAWTGF